MWIIAPGAAEVPASGFCWMTSPAGTVSLYSVACWPTASPAAVMAASASACVRPARSGTVSTTNSRSSQSMTPFLGVVRSAALNTAAGSAGLNA